MLQHFFGIEPQKLMSEKGALSAVLKGKCPQCRKGEMFQFSLWNIASFNKTHTHCDHCKLRYEREPGFFYGAMYVSYALSVAIFIVSVFVLYHGFNDPALSTYIITVSVAALVLYPVNFRYSRILFLHVFGGIKYDPGKSN